MPKEDHRMQIVFARIFALNTIVLSHNWGKLLSILFLQVFEEILKIYFLIIIWHTHGTSYSPARSS